MDRVQASEAWGRGFESHAAHHKNRHLQLCVVGAFLFIMIV